NCVINEFYYGIYFRGGSSPKVLNESSIENVTVSDNWHGIYLYAAHYTNLENITSFSNAINGVFLEQSHSNEVHNLNASENTAGIRLYNSRSNNVHDITVSNNIYGIDITSSSSYDNTFDNISAKENFRKDIYFNDVYTCSNTFNNITGSGDREIMIVNESVNIENKILSQLILCNADNSNITNVTIQGSSVYDNNGLFAYYVDNSNFTDITSSNNFIGIKLKGSADYAEHNTFNNLILNNNNGDGIGFEMHDRARYNNLTNITASNTNYGIRLLYGFNNLQDIYFSDASFGIYSDNNSIKNANISNYAGNGISLFSGADSNSFQNITSNNNGGGIRLWSSVSNNNFINITAKENTFYDLFYEPYSIDYCTNSFENVIGSGDREIILTNEGINIENKILSELILCNADNSNITNVTIQGSSVHDNNALYMYFTDNANLTGITSNENRYGIYSVNWGDVSKNNIFEDITVNNNDQYGLYLDYINNTDMIT
ncbi:MAG: right-handed parallel beta-helix repeat-containing protein, partial [Nanoarchaeota archaeon]|nr:right-handed parallel beta-helix repeat-containing protein [Nanoarchaeota archaeon]